MDIELFSEHDNSLAQSISETYSILSLHKARKNHALLSISPVDLSAVE